MGLVTEKLIEILAEQIEQGGTVVWYDPDQHYGEVASGLTTERLGNAQLFHYHPKDGFFWLRHELEPHWQPLDLNKAPKLLIYAPLEQSATHHALIEYEIGGVVMQPGQQPPECNTALAAVARLALESIFPQARLEEIVNNVAENKLSLAELDQLAERGAEAQTGTLAVIFNTGNISEIVLHFLANPDVDEQIAEKRAESDIATALSATLGIEFDPNHESHELRVLAARQILTTEFIESLGDALPDALKTFPIAQQSAARQAAVDLAFQWRNRRDLASSFVEWSIRIQNELSIGSLNIDLARLAESETFLIAEQHLQSLVEEALLKRVSSTLLELARSRIAGFWSSQQPEVKMRWEITLNAGRVLDEAARIEIGLKGKQWSASKLFAQYVFGDSPWCNLDTAQRHLERDIHRYAVDLQSHDSLHRLIVRASQQYASTVNSLAEQFVRAFKDEQFELADVQLQTDIYRDHVAQRVQKTRVAYILVDAFRFEMAREFHMLVQSGETNWDSELIPAVATPPTITDVGMASLMPGAEDGIVLQAEKGTLVPYIGGIAVRNAKARFDRLNATLGEDALIIPLDDIAPLRQRGLSNKLNKARMVVVTASDDIDGLGENMPQKARRSMDEVFSLLRRGLSALFSAGIQEIVISADHGFLLADRLDDSQKIDAPQGNQQLLKRRVWVGRGGAEHPAVMRAHLSAFGIGGDLELVTPYGLSAFKVQGGNTEYFHGGLSLQELIIPILIVSPTASATQTIQAEIQWNLTLGSHKITSPYVSVTIEGSSSQLLPVDPPTIRVEIRDQDQILSVPVSASYGFQDATKDVKLRVGKSSQAIEKNTVMVLLSERPAAHSVEVQLLDANTGISLSRIGHVEVDLSLFD